MENWWNATDPYLSIFSSSSIVASPHCNDPSSKMKSVSIGSKRPVMVLFKGEMHFWGKCIHKTKIDQTVREMATSGMDFKGFLGCPIQTNDPDYRHHVTHECKTVSEFFCEGWSFSKNIKDEARVQTERESYWKSASVPSYLYLIFDTHYPFSTKSRPPCPSLDDSSFFFWRSTEKILLFCTGFEVCFRILGSII